MAVVTTGVLGPSKELMRRKRQRTLNPVNELHLQNADIQSRMKMLREISVPGGFVFK